MRVALVLVAIVGCKGGGRSERPPEPVPVAATDAVPVAAVDAAPMTWRGPNLYTLVDGDVAVGVTLKPPGSWQEDWTDEHEHLTSPAGSFMDVTLVKGDPPHDAGGGENDVVIVHVVSFPAGAWFVRCEVKIVAADAVLLPELVRQCTELELQQEPDPRLAWTIEVKPAKVSLAKVGTVTVRYTVTNRGTAVIDAKAQSIELWLDGAASMTLGMAFGNGGFESIWTKLPPGKTVDDERTGMDDLVGAPGDHVISIRHLDHELARATLHVTK